MENPLDGPEFLGVVGIDSDLLVLADVNRAVFGLAPMTDANMKDAVGGVKSLHLASEAYKGDDAIVLKVAKGSGRYNVYGIRDRSGNVEKVILYLGNNTPLVPIDGKKAGL